VVRGGFGGLWWWDRHVFCGADNGVSRWFGQVVDPDEEWGGDRSLEFSNDLYGKPVGSDELSRSRG